MNHCSHLRICPYCKIEILTCHSDHYPPDVVEEQPPMHRRMFTLVCESSTIIAARVHELALRQMTVLPIDQMSSDHPFTRGCHCVLFFCYHLRCVS